MGKTNNKNMQFINNVYVNNQTYFDYLNRFKKIALSIFEWKNLPKSMNAQYLERCLYYNGMSAFLKDSKYGFINTNCAGSSSINIYGLPTKLNCYSYNYQTIRTLYTGIEGYTEPQRKNLENSQAILVQNNWDRLPTAPTLELFAYRLYEAERTCDVNIKAQKTPIMIVVDEKQRLLMENLYSQYDGNKPYIFGDKNQLSGDMLKAINTEAPFIADKVMDYKKEIWNEALTFLGVNNILVDKKERLITDEANSNNELINLNLQSYLVPRQQACREFNEKFKLTGTDKEISVRVRSDLHNIIKQAESVVKDFKEVEELENNLDGKEGEENGNLHNRT